MIVIFSKYLATIILKLLIINSRYCKHFWKKLQKNWKTSDDYFTTLSGTDPGCPTQQLTYWSRESVSLFVYSHLGEVLSRLE